MKLYLTRHGQTEWNVQKRMQGRNNSPLTQLGMQQAEKLGDYLKDVSFDCIYSSASPRALHTAELLRGERNIPIETSEELMEISLGEWEGMTFSDAEKQYPEQFHNFWHQPERYFRVDSESFEQLRQRISNEIERIADKHPNETVLVVAHGMVLKTLFTYFKQQSINEIALSPHIHSACVCQVERVAGNWQVVRWNENVVLL